MNDYIKLVSDAVLFRGFERLLTILAAMFFAWLGFRLFCIGVESTKSKLDVKGFGFRMTLVGTGPGLFFMAFGGAVLVYAITTRLEVKPLNFTIQPTTQTESPVTPLPDTTPPTTGAPPAPPKSDTKQSNATGTPKPTAAVSSLPGGRKSEKAQRMEAKGFRFIISPDD